VCTVEYSWSWYHGYKPDALTGGKPVALSAGNGNGFKGGGYDMPPNSVPNPIPQHVLRFNVSFSTRQRVSTPSLPRFCVFLQQHGLQQQSGLQHARVGSDNTSSVSVGILRNNIAFAGALTSNMNLGGSLISDENNSWTRPSVSPSRQPTFRVLNLRLPLHAQRRTLLEARFASRPRTRRACWYGQCAPG